MSSFEHDDAVDVAKRQEVCGCHRGRRREASHRQFPLHDAVEAPSEFVEAGKRKDGASDVVPPGAGNHVRDMLDVEVLLVGEIQALDAQKALIVGRVDEIDIHVERHARHEPRLVVDMGAEGADAEGGAHMARRRVAVVVAEDLAESVHGQGAYVDLPVCVKRNDRVIERAAPDTVKDCAFGDVAAFGLS